VRRLILSGAAVVLCAAAAGCGGGGGSAVARVGGDTVSREQLDQAVEHFREEAQREGKPFADGPAARRSLLGLLVYRARIDQGAAALGITVPQDAVEQRVAAAGAEEATGGKDGEAFLQSSVRAQLLPEAVYRKLADRIHDADPQRRQAKRNAALQRWVTSLESRYPVR
jgi:hypothetical protein